MSTIWPHCAGDHPTGFARRRRSPSISRTICLSVLVSAVLCAGQIFAQTDIHDPALAPGFDILASDPFTGSVAASDDALGTFVNPAALGMARAFNGYIFHAHSDSSFDGDSGLLLSADHLGFGAEWKRFSPVPKYNRYTLAYGGEVHPGVYLGTSYQWLSSSDPPVDHLSFWDLGLMLRPSRFLSLGATVHGLNRPHFGGQRIERAYRYGVAVRPMTNRLTLYADGTYDEDEDLDRQRDFIFGAEIEPLDGLLLRVAADEEGRASLGFEIGLSHVAAGTYNHFDEDQEYRGGTTYLRFTEERRRTILRRPNRFVELDLAGEILEERRGFSLSGRGDHTTTELLRFFRKAEDDPAIRGIILRLGGLRAGWATLEELREALLDFRATGKTVVCYLEDSSFGPYYLASAADYIILNPDGYLLLFGLRMERIFVTGTLEKIGVDVDLTRVGRYKSAAEMVTRDSMSDEAREMSNWIIEDIYDHVVADIAEGRGLSPEQVRAAIDAAPLIAADILDYGLVDTLAYEDEIDEIARSVAGIGFSKTRPSEIMAAEYRYDWRPPPRIALVYATGMITSGKSGTDFLTGAKTMGAETIAEAIKEAREDRSIKAIVFRIDSGGGSGLASGIIWREVSRTIGVKPFIVSMSDVAGSGGYHIACPSDLIIADGNTITGSIGVISGKPTLKRLYNKLGITKDLVYRGAHARALSDYYRLTEEEMELLDQATREMYWDFVRKVAEGRGMTPAQVDSIGEGRVFTGRQAHSNGLIDELGGLERAIAIAIERAGLARDAEVEVITYPKGRWPFLLGMAQSALSHTLGSLPIEALRESGAGETLGLLELLEEEPCLYLMPDTLEPE
jgi:protease-4